MPVSSQSNSEKKKRSEELRAVFKLLIVKMLLENECRGRFNTLQVWYILLNRNAVVIRPFCYGAAEKICFQKMKSRFPIKNNVRGVWTYRDVSCVRYLSFCSGFTVVSFAYCKYLGIDIAVLQLETSCGWPVKDFFVRS